jgi:hypothetical protein
LKTNRECPIAGVGYLHDTEYSVRYYVAVLLLILLHESHKAVTRYYSYIGTERVIKAFGTLILSQFKEPNVWVIRDALVLSLALQFCSVCI